jgi:hypothetical protein
MPNCLTGPATPGGDSSKARVHCAGQCAHLRIGRHQHETAQRPAAASARGRDVRRMQPLRCARQRRRRRAQRHLGPGQPRPGSDEPGGNPVCPSSCDRPSFRLQPVHRMDCTKHAVTQGRYGGSSSIHATQVPPTHHASQALNSVKLCINHQPTDRPRTHSCSTHLMWVLRLHAGQQPGWGT